MGTVHDSGYKKLFSNRTIFRQLIETFVQEEWVNEIDFDQCETLDKSFVSDHYKETESDLIYKVRFRGREAYLVVLLEFQSTVDHFMALRVLNYLTNFYMDYVASADARNSLPPVFPIVLYNGDARWTAPVTLEALIQDAEVLGRYMPHFQYCAIIEREYTEEELLAIRNLVSTLFLTEAHFGREKVIQEFTAVFQREPDRQAVSLLFNWFRQLTLHGRFDTETFEEIHRVYETIEEAHTMLLTALAKDHERFRQEGLQEGRQLGLQEGRQKGLQEGRQKGLVEGRQEGLQQGLFNGLIQAITTLLANKFGQSGTDLVQDISTLHDVSVLQETLEAIVRANTVEQVREFVAAARKSRHN